MEALKGTRCDTLRQTESIDIQSVTPKPYT